MAVEDIYAKACEAVERNNLDYAVKLFRQVLAARPDYQDARAALRMTERRRMEGKSSAVTAPIDAALTTLKTLIGSARKKLEAYEDYLEKHPNSFWGLMNAAGAARKAGLQGEAANVYKDALRFKPDDKSALRRLSDTLHEMGEDAEAVKFLGRLSALQPQNRELGDELRDLEASTHMAAHRVEQANSFRDLIRDKDEAERFEKEGRMAVTTDDLRREIASQEKELEANPNQVNRILRVAQLYEDVGEPQKALELLTEKRQALPDNYEIREKLGDIAIHLADAQIAGVRRKLEVEPGSPAVEKRLAELISRRDKYALDELKLADRPAPDRPRPAAADGPGAVRDGPVQRGHRLLPGAHAGRPLRPGGRPHAGSLLPEEGPVRPGPGAVGQGHRAAPRDGRRGQGPALQPGPSPRGGWQQRRSPEGLQADIQPGHQLPGRGEESRQPERLNGEGPEFKGVVRCSLFVVS